MIRGDLSAQARALESTHSRATRGNQSRTTWAHKDALLRPMPGGDTGSSVSPGQVIPMNESDRRPFRPASVQRVIIRRRVTGETLYCDEAKSVAALMESAAQQGVSLAGADLPGAKLAAANIDGIFLSLADLSQGDFMNASMRRSDFRRANLLGATFNGADMEASDLMHSNLTGADLTGAILHKANLGNAELAGANFKNADLSFCNLNGANLTGANLEGANLEGTNLHAAVLDKTAQDRAERRKEMDRLVFSPVRAILLQLILMAVQVLGLVLVGPFQLFWFVGVTTVNAYLMLNRSWWWGLGLIWQTIFFGLLWS